MRVFTAESLDELTVHAQQSQRGRQHRNIHADYGERVQRLFNAIEPGSYIRPHRHLAPGGDELLVSLRGQFALILFSSDGAVRSVVRFGVQHPEQKLAAGVEVESGEWHTVVALEPGSVLLEIKAGPFDPAAPKDFPQWAPAEGTAEALTYHRSLASLVSDQVSDPRRFTISLRSNE